ncbi:hypothetical protein WJX73_000202 [Symbiochloris irregularis]|uniref:Trs120/TRAPPC9 N-terminal domain-containing protein n=1 Tax=Symbiochloris irregularis TaxID=706552 RepID=A0AAW1P1F2_9CHLO
MFSASELHVAVIPIGKVPQEVLLPYYTLITRHRQVELQVLRSFYKEQGKSPFRYLPWKTGSMHFRFLPADMAMQPSLLKDLHFYRKILGIIGICHCPANSNLPQAYAKFEAACRQFPDAFVLRCFAFEPSDEQVGMSTADMPNLMMFPPTLSGLHQLESHAEVVMLDFAAGLLAELEKWMSTASTAMVSMASYADSEAFIGPTSVVEEVHKRLISDEEQTKRRRYGRLRKAMGDVALLAGSPVDADEHYSTAVEMSRPALDFVWAAAALEGRAHSQVMEACVSTGAVRRAISDAGGTPRAPQGDSQDGAAPQQSKTSRGSPFGGAAFWTALRTALMLERDVRALYVDAKITLRRKGGLTMQVEQDLKMARFLVGWGGAGVRSEVSSIVSNMVESVSSSPHALTHDRLLTLTEAAQVLGSVGASRKRALHMWQAIDSARDLKSWLDQSTLQTARKALEPAEDPQGVPEGEEELLRRRKPLGGGVPRHWGFVRTACIEGILTLSTNTRSFADMWDAAARLLSDHYRELPAERQLDLCRYLEHAATHMSAEDKARLFLGPPPLLCLLQAAPPPAHLAPVTMTLHLPASTLETAKSSSPFIYNPFADKDKGGVEEAVVWSAGERINVDLEIWNPTAINFSGERHISRMVLEVAYSPADGQAEPSLMGTDRKIAVWRPSVVSVNMPPQTGPSKVTLGGTPLVKGIYTLVGCKLSWAGVTWLQSWAPRKPRLPWLGQPSARSLHSPDPLPPPTVRLKVVDPLPSLEVRLDTPSTSATLSEADGSPQLSLSSRSSGGATKGGDAAAGSGSGSGSQQQGGSGTPAPYKSASAEVLKPPPLAQVVALKGQILHWQLYCVNRGMLPVGLAVLTAEAGSVKERKRDGAGTVPETPSASRAHAALPPMGPGAYPLECSVRDSALTEALPLQPRERAVVPVIVHAAQVASYITEDEANIDFKLEYMRGTTPAAQDSTAKGESKSDSENNDSSGPSTSSSPRKGEAQQQQQQPGSNLGRRIVVPAHLRLRPSLQVSNIAFCEHQEPIPALPPEQVGDEPSPQQQSHLAAGTGGGVRRVCVLEANVINRTDLAMQVWVGERQQNAEAAWEAIRRHPRPWDRAPPDAEEGPLDARCKLVSGRQHTRVALPVRTSLAESVLSQAMLSRQQRSKGKAPVNRDDVIRQACGELLCRHLALFWRREDLHDPDSQMEGGCLPLSTHAVSLGLTPPAMSLLAPWEIQASLVGCMQPPTGESGPAAAVPRRLRGPGDTGDDGTQQLGAVWGLEVLIGQPLKLQLQVRSQANVDAIVNFSLVGQTYSEVESDAASSDSNVALTGATAGVQLRVAAKSQASHSCAVLFLDEGLYRLHTHPVTATAVQQKSALSVPGQSMDVCSNPLYILVR